ncbi:hypothetical protein AB4156_41600, partial [Cupriavidus sp. 2MCAB6]|uniref:hypothetical protein n=1 Tax=Cupriavidus sp. 2MCAB6 TaxID=3232981 RepID=UPI003F8FE5B2
GKTPAGSTYLADRKWRDVPAMQTERQSTSIVQIGPWTRDWWLLLLDRVFSGRSPSLWVQLAEAGKSTSATGADLAAASRRVGDLKAFLCDGPEIDAWRPWLGKRGARIPMFTGQFRVFLPAPTPPGVVVEPEVKL